MYLYDTRNENNKSLPLNGWIFPCFKCNIITSKFIELDYICKNIIDKVEVPLCKSCDKNNIKLENKKIKKLNNYVF